jgi:hypothetical protein
VQHAVVTVRTAEMSAYRHRVRVTLVSYETAQQAVGMHVVLRAPRDDINAGYFGIAFLRRAEKAESGFVHLSLEEIVFMPKRVSNSVGKQIIGIDLVGPGEEVAFHHYAPGLRLIGDQAYNAVLHMGGLGWRTQKGQADSGMEKLKQEPFLDKATDQALRRYRTRQELVRMGLKNTLLDRCGAVCCMSGLRPNVPDGPSLLTLSHYWPLGMNGPDTLRNRELMTCMIHQIWENVLVTMLSDRRLVFAPDLQPLFRAEFSGRTSAHFPGNPSVQPDPRYLEYHRVNVFEKRLAGTSYYASRG